MAVVPPTPAGPRQGCGSARLLPGRFDALAAAHFGIRLQNDVRWHLPRSARTPLHHRRGRRGLRRFGLRLDRLLGDDRRLWHAFSCGFERIAPDVLGLLADGVPRSKPAIVEALAGRHDREDVALTLIRLAVTGRVVETNGKYALASDAG